MNDNQLRNNHLSPGNDSKKRLFIAIPLVPETNKALTAYCRKIAEQHPGLNPRFTPASKRHLTLSFLGALEQIQIDAAISVVRTFEHPGIRLQLSRIARFPDQQSRIITALPDDSVDLASLHSRLQESLEGNGFPALSRPFRPHISLTRIKSTKDDLPIQISPPIAMPVAEIILYESQLTDTGSCYIPMEHCRLTATDGR